LAESLPLNRGRDAGDEVVVRLAACCCCLAAVRLKSDEGVGLVDRCTWQTNHAKLYKGKMAGGDVAGGIENGVSQCVAGSYQNFSEWNCE
jgi:hypothetical protein